MDSTDIKILEMLQKNGREAHSNIAKAVGLSAPSVSERIKKLSSEGIVHRYTAILNDKRIGKELTAFVNVYISNPRYEEAFVKEVTKLDDVLECHHVTGDYSYLLKVKTRNTATLEEIIARKIRAIPGVARTLTNVVLSSLKEETYLNLEEPARGG
jgi:Lrp/AsnC family leucine-responsive transcriptional regulator